MATQLATTGDNNVPALTPEGERFALRQRQARMFALSPLVPDHLRKGTPEQALANCYIALTLAEAMGEVPLVVMQNIHVVHGVAGFKTEYKIARANTSGVFRGRIDWRVDRSNPDNLSVTAFATLKDTDQEVSVTCDMAMAKAEGWTRNSKYQTMPEVMLRYRSASFLIRFYAGDVMLGYQTVEEIEDVAIARSPDLHAAPLSSAMLIEQAQGGSEAEEIIDGETGEVVGDGALANDGTLDDDNPTAAEGPADEQRGEDTNPQADFVSDTKPATAKRNQTWYNPADGKLKYAHDKGDHGIKWYMQPQEDGAADPEPATGPSEAQIIADRIADAADLDALDELQELFNDAKPRLKGDDITMLRGLFADRRNELA